MMAKSDVTWAPWRLKVTGLFAQLFIQTNNKVPHCCPCVGGIYRSKVDVTIIYRTQDTWLAGETCPVHSFYIFYLRCAIQNCITHSDRWIPLAKTSNIKPQRTIRLCEISAAFWKYCRLLKEHFSDVTASQINYNITRLFVQLLTQASSKQHRNINGHLFLCVWAGGWN